MKSLRIFIVDVLSPNLQSRTEVKTLAAHIRKMKYERVIIDFTHVQFATRSFIDEFYNVFLQDENVAIDNVPKDIRQLLDVVEKTQHKSKNTVTDNTVVRCETLSDVQRLLNSLSI